MSNGSLSNNLQKSNMEVFDNARNEFFFRADIIQTASIFLKGVPVEKIFFDSSASGKEFKKNYKKVCVSIEKDISILSLSLKTISELVISGLDKIV